MGVILIFIFRAVMTGIVIGILSYLYKTSLLNFYMNSAVKTRIFITVIGGILFSLSVVLMFAPLFASLLGFTGILAIIVAAVIALPGIFFTTLLFLLCSFGGITSVFQQADRIVTPVASICVGFLTGLFFTAPSVSAIAVDPILVITLLFCAGVISGAISGIIGMLIDFLLGLMFSSRTDHIL
jgi:hypothetical protein